MDAEGLSRRVFVQSTAAGALVLGLAAAARGADEAPAPPGAAAPEAVTPQVGCALLGTGAQGQEILRALARLPHARVLAYHDPYPRAAAKAAKLAPEAQAAADAAELLAVPGVEAVFVATPSHQHREPVEAALAAGKHVYCEAPLAVTVDEAKAVAQAGKAAGTVFQVGLQQRANPLYRHVYLHFVKTGAAGTLTSGRAQWHRKESWYRAASTPERERALNWRLYHASSAGLLGEVGIHQLDALSWMLNALPLRVHGFGAKLCWTDDDREIADTVQCVLEYPGGVHALYEASLCNSFDSAHQLLRGTFGTFFIRPDRAWLVKENDAPTLGWEVYARKDTVGDGLGIALVANATKLLDEGIKPGEQAKEQGVPEIDPLLEAVDQFLRSVRLGRPPLAGADLGYRAAVVAIKANEAVVTGQPVEFRPEWFELG